MITRKLELFRTNETTVGMVLKQRSKFTKVNRFLRSYREGTQMIKGEEVLFRVPEDQLAELGRILGLKAMPERID